MWIDNYFMDKKPSFGVPKTFMYEEFFDFWCGHLLEKIVNVFKWNGLPFNQMYLETYLILRAYAGCVKLKDSKNIFDTLPVSLSGVTNYPMEKCTATGVTPLENVVFHVYGTDRISVLNTIWDTEGVVIYNNSGHFNLIPLITYYANILAHIDLSLQRVAIKIRQDGLIKGSNSKVVDAVNTWYKDTEKGKSTAVLDESTFVELSEGIIVNPLKTNAGSEITDLLNARTKYLAEFFAEIGINSAYEKQERLITNEVDVGFNKVLFNISDMLECRQLGARQLTELFGTEISVSINPNIKIKKETTQDGTNESENNNDVTDGM